MNFATRLILAAPALVTVAAPAQNPAPPIQAAASSAPVAPAATPLPADPAALLNLAVQVNALHGADMKPWHVRASWQTTEKGNVADRGIIEEWWAAEHEFKITETSSGASRSSWGTDQGIYLLTSGGVVAPQAGLGLALLTQPIVNPRFLTGQNSRLQMRRIAENGVSLDCVHQEYLTADGQVAFTVDAHGERHASESQYCFDDELPALRTRAMGTSRAAFNSLVRYQGRYVARQITLESGDGQQTQISIDSVEDLDPVVEADFVPDPAAHQVAPIGKVAIASGVAQGNRIAGDAPQYPPDAERARIQGTVVLEATISKEGAVTNLRVISGPPMLQQAALDAVKTWKYRPYLLNGQPVAVETQINVVFALP